jgi:rhomboid protease GluP
VFLHLSSIIIHFFSDYPIPLAGSSGPGYGLLGMYIFLVLKHRNKFPTYDKRFIITFTVMGFIMTFLIPGISISGHIGGFVGGILLSPFVFKPSVNDRKKFKRIKSQGKV